MPLLANTTASTAWVSVTQSIITSVFSTSSAILLATCAPELFKGRVFSVVRFQTVKGKPAASKRWHMGTPIKPKPIKPIRVVIIFTPPYLWMQILHDSNFLFLEQVLFFTSKPLLAQSDSFFCRKT